MFQSSSVIKLQDSTTERWHDEAVDNPYAGFMSIVCQQHAFNFNLWHEEDVARSKDVTDERIAQVKRAIDKLNQNRNDWIEKLDDWITETLEQNAIVPRPNAPINTETPGSVIDRLSILSIRLFHLEEQLQRSDVDESHIQSVQQKIAICRLQQAELGQALDELMEEISLGNKRHRTYRQFKMYNDPTLNPYLYGKAAA
ncbi:MAG: DUF4254 domain-containing protein [Planctomycetota bacterium]|nr:DUF4254 domain-containing protein [Planctomycetota bacterium]